jgi:hypothetical protein
MEIPESINNITTEVVASQLAASNMQMQVNLNNIIDLIRQQLPYYDNKAFDEGLAFYRKDASSDKDFAKNLCYLYCETLTKAIKTSSITDDNKAEVERAITSSIDGIIQNIEGIYRLVRFLNSDKNIIDVQKISCIILGYVIDTIKRKNVTKN